MMLVLALSALFAQTPATAVKTGVLKGQATDPSGAVVVGAVIKVKAADGSLQQTTSDKSGNYIFRSLPSGNANLSATAAGFSAYTLQDVIVPAGASQQLDISFSVAGKSEQVTVEAESARVDVNPENNASATILKDKDLDALSDDPDELEQDLLALAGPSAGPNGGQIFIDGFSNGTLPPKSSIREVRINQNPLSAQYDRPGFGRVEVFTKPGSDTWHGQLMFNESDKAINTRNPYVTDTDIPNYHTERYSGNLSGALTKKSSIFLNFERRDINELSAIDATTVDGKTLNYSSAVLAPEDRTNFSPRLDLQLGNGNTLTARYQYMDNNEYNQGIGAFTLAQRAYGLHEHQQTLQVSDTQLFGTHLVNETRFQYMHDINTQLPVAPGYASINVASEFNNGSYNGGIYSDTSNYYELQNYTSWSHGKHFVKFGGRLRVTEDNNLSYGNFNGSINYMGSGTLNPLEAWLAGTPAQASIVSGSPGASVNYADVGLYAEDDWKLRPNLTLSYGVRYESQSTIHDKNDWAPRIGLSWGLGNSKSAPKTVVRLGYGIFYDRLGSTSILNANRLNGVTEQETIYTGTTASPIVCPTGSYDANGMPVAYSFGQCTLPTAANSTPTVYQISSNLHAPYMMQLAASVERQVGKLGTVSVTYLNSLGRHQFDTINANAPETPGDLTTRPYGNENLYRYYSEGEYRQNQIITNVQFRVSQKFSLMGFYALGWADSNVGSLGSNPTNATLANNYHLGEDWGRASFDIRSRVFLSGTANLAHNIRISPFVILNSGAPFNITTGTDLNGDSFYNDRPSFADATLCTAGSTQYKQTPYGCFNLTPGATDKRIPINFGNGPSNVQVNLRVSKTWGFGPDLKKDNSGNSNQGGGPPGGGPGRGGPGGPPGGGPRGMSNVFGSSTTTHKYNLTVAAMARNLFNTWNPGLPVGNLSSTDFGKSNSLAGGPFSSGTANRRVDLSATFTF